jgi:hypothetical protein
MASYKKRLEEDLDRWIAAGWVPADKRGDILASVPQGRGLDTATALGFVGAVLLGVAVIALVAANWDAMNRLVRFSMVLAAFAGFAGAAAFSAYKGRVKTSDALLTIAACVFAAAIGLTGQIFDIVGEPRPALYLAAAGAGALALAGRSIGAGIASVVFAALGDFQDSVGFMMSGGSSRPDVPALALVAPAAGYLAWRWKSAALAHAAAAGILIALIWVVVRSEAEAQMALMAALLLGVFAFIVRAQRAKQGLFAGVFYGWFTWGALALFAVSGFDGESSLISGLPHRVLWLALAGGVIALGRFDRHGWVSTSGVLALIGAISVILMDLGLDLISAALIFGFGALIAFGVGWLINRNAKKSPGDAP